MGTIADWFDRLWSRPHEVAALEPGDPAFADADSATLISSLARQRAALRVERQVGVFTQPEGEEIIKRITAELVRRGVRLPDPEVFR